MDKQFIYKLKYGSEVYKCTHNVTGFEDEGVKYGKASENKGIIKSYTAEIQLIGNDAIWLKDIYVNKGFNEQIKFEIYKDNFINGETLEYYAFIDLSTLVCYNNRVTFSLKQGGFITYLDNISKKEVTLGNNSGFTNVNYSGNKYNFDIDIVSIRTINPTISDDEIKYILPSAIKENNNNLEDLREFKGAVETELIDGAKITDDNCFIKIYPQKYIDKIKFNFNVPSFSVNNYWFGFTPKYARATYKFTLSAYNNVLENWEFEDASKIFSQQFNIYLNYTIHITKQVPDLNGNILEFIGKCTNPNYYYVNESNIAQYISGNDYDNIKFILTATLIELKCYDQNYQNGVQLISYKKNIAISLTIDIKCTMKNFQLVPYKGINSWRLETVYKAIVQQNRTPYRVVYDLSKLEQSNLYLTSASELCGDTKLTTTLDQLLQFIYLATGLRHIVNEINGVYYVSFEKYENSFKEVEIAKIDNVSDIVMECEPDKIYTDVEIGWANKDTGIFKSTEYNTINKFRSGYTNIESNILTLNCTYSASVTDIETIAYNSGYNDKSNDAKDIFVIECWNDNGLIRNLQYSGSGTMVICGNVSLTPRRLLEVHKYELSDLFFHNNILTFNSSNGLADIVINGIRENESFIFNNQIMQPFILDFSGVINKSVLKIDPNKYGYFTFDYNDTFVRGWIAEGSDSVTIAPNGNVSKLRLIVKKETKL